MKTAIFIPPLKAASGGVAVLLELARVLHKAGRPVELVFRDAAIPGLDPGPVAIRAWDGLALAEEDVWLVPEGWSNALLPGLQAGCRCLVYVQNWAYLFSSLPQGLDLHGLAGLNTLNFLAVSAPVAHFVEQALGLPKPCPILRPGIDLRLFRPPLEGKTDGPLTVAWMPRKNKALARQIIQIVQARRAGSGKPVPRFLAIEGKSRAEVAAMLRQAHIFLATGFPEGCPLPPLEAMASGCLAAGFAGFGGFDYMKSPEDPGLPFLARGWTPGRSAGDAPWGPNGLFVPDGDVLAAALALDQALDWGPRSGEWLHLVAEAGKTAAAYSLPRQKEAVLKVWEELDPSKAV